MLKNLLLLLLLFSAFSTMGQSADTLQVYFPLNVPKLNDTAKHRIDSLIYNDILIPGQSIVILGYADYLGDKSYNKALSLKRATNVMLYLEQSGFKGENIKLCIGKGKIERKITNGKAGFADDRKVDIAIEKQPAPKEHPTTDISKLKVNETLVLDNIYFLPGRHTFRPESEPALEKLFQALNDHKKLKIQIEGHICCIQPSQIQVVNDMVIYNGGFTFKKENLSPEEKMEKYGGRDIIDGWDYDSNVPELSYNRAKAVYNYLIEKGIDSTRLKCIGFGSTRPMVVEKTEADENKNRRVEIRILKND